MALKSSFLLLLTSISAVTCHVARSQHVARGDTPALPYDSNTSKYCSYWIDNTDKGLLCTQVPSQWTISISDFLRWNPSLAPNCNNFTTGRSYCVEVTGEPAVTPPPTTPTPTASTSITPPSPVSSGNGIATPQPTQPLMVNNCDAFYFVPEGSSCDAISSSNSITPAQFLAWNPSVGNTCSGLWANVYVCVSIIGHTPTKPTSASPTPTKPSNGITTPLPTQPSIVNNCDAFYLVPPNETCDSIARKNGITAAQFLAWNPSVGSTCSGLWADAYACVSIIGHTIPPANTVTTPVPVQTGMVGNCKTFHFVVKDETCATITKKYGITEANFVKWNPAVGTGCRSMWANTYACVAVLG
ncbi:LysM domain-containing protein [Paraphoma chrysanthemicola]|nr:LysM domain-containing protein [Paraphoma chrysanthemicola]